MKKQKTFGSLLIASGLLVTAISLFGYELGVAEQESFGAFQLAGMLVGLGVASWGLFQFFRDPS